MLKRFKATVDTFDKTSDGYLAYVILSFVVPKELKAKAMAAEKEYGGKYSRFGFGAYVNLDKNGFTVDDMIYVDEYAQDNDMGYGFDNEEKITIINAVGEALVEELGKE